MDSHARVKREDYYEDLNQAKRNLGFGQSRRQQLAHERAHENGGGEEVYDDEGIKKVICASVK